MAKLAGTDESVCRRGEGGAGGRGRERLGEGGSGEEEGKGGITMERGRQGEGERNEKSTVCWEQQKQFLKVSSNTLTDR